MYICRKLTLALTFLSFSAVAFGQTVRPDPVDEVDELKIAALEALMSAPPERALPIVRKVLQGDGSDELKSRALFVLSQIDEPEAQQLLIDTAQTGSGMLKLEAVRMIGIGGNSDAMAGLSDIYASGDSSVRHAVLEAYLIADDSDAVYEIAANARSPEEFAAAVEMLGAMDALDKLRALRASGAGAGMSQALIEAYAIAGDVESLRALAVDDSDPEAQRHAIESLGITDDPEVGPFLLDIYRGSDSAEIRNAALEGMLMADHEEGVTELFRESRDPAEKVRLLEALVMMDSDAVWDIVDATFENE